MDTKRRKLMDTKSTSEPAKETELDRLSMLPETLILHILSLVPDTKIAVQMCILFKRWSNDLWIHLPSLYFNSESFHGSHYYKTSYEKFKNFVCHIMSQRKLDKIRSLRFSDTISRYCCLNSDQEEQFKERLIAYVARHGVEELETDRKDFFTGCLEFCEELHSLVVRQCCHENIELKLSKYPALFASLTRLHLESVDLLIEKDSVDLFTNCVNLEELTLINCRSKNRSGFHITISCPRLVRLKMVNFYCKTADELSISAPRLLELDLEDFKKMKLVVDGCPVLERVKIIHNGSSGLKFEYELKKYYQKVIEKVFPKSKSLVWQFLGRKWEFTKCNNFASVKMYGLHSDNCDTTVTWKLDAEFRSNEGLEYVWNEDDFVKIFGKFCFVTCPIVKEGFRRSMVKLNKIVSKVISDSEVWENHGENEIMAERKFFEAFFTGKVSVSKNWKCHVVRISLEGEVVWEKQWPN